MGVTVRIDQEMSADDLLDFVAGKVGSKAMDIAEELRDTMVTMLTVKLYPPSSEPGDAPAARTFWLASSVTTHEEDRNDRGSGIYVLASVSVDALYGRPLELGFLNALTGYWVPARPFVIPSALMVAQRNRIQLVYG